MKMSNEQSARLSAKAKTRVVTEARRLLESPEETQAAKAWDREKELRDRKPQAIKGVH